MNVAGRAAGVTSARVGGRGARADGARRRAGKGPRSREYVQAAAAPLPKGSEPGRRVRRQMTVGRARRVDLRRHRRPRARPLRAAQRLGRPAAAVRRDLERKPVSLVRFRLVWPLLWQRRPSAPGRAEGHLLLLLRRLVRALAARIGDRSCVEIAAGDGTLSRFLPRGRRRHRDRRPQLEARVELPGAVVRQDAREALRGTRPRS